MSDSLAAVILAAGQGTRMNSDLPKVLHPLAGRSMIGHVAAAVAPLAPAPLVVVHRPGDDHVAAAVPGAHGAEQKVARGTGDAVCAAMALVGAAATVLVLYGDTPFITTDTLRRMLDLRAGADAPAVVALGFHAAPPNMYGRMIRGTDGGLERIVEARDAGPDELAVTLCNSGIMAIAGDRLANWLARLGDDNAKGEFYLTDIIALARADGAACAVVEGEEAEFMGIDDRLALARAETVLQDRLRLAAMAAGVTLIEPAAVHFSHDTVLGRDCVIHPHVVFGPGVVIAAGVTVKSFSHLEACTVAEGAAIGPHARVRGGAKIGAHVHLGNFVEVKNATLASGVKAGHLAYLGDAEIGADSNIGAGTITCNYDGVDKHRTTIGAGAFIGSNTALVAPVRVGAGSMVGAGSTIAGDVADGDLAVGRAATKTVTGGAQRFRDRRLARKKQKG